MKTGTKTTAIALILCTVFSLFALSSCGGKDGEEAAATDATSALTAAETVSATERATDPATQAATERATDPATQAATEAATEAATAPETEPETAPETTDDPDRKWSSIAPKITMIAERDRKIKIECSEFKTAEKASRNDVYLQGPDAVEEGETPAIQQMVYARNRAADELLHTKVDFVYWDFDWGQQAGQINTVVQGGASDAPDLFVNMLYDLNRELLNGSFKDVTSIPNGYFDFDASGWLTGWMENLSFTGDRAYILGSDYFIDVFRSMAVLPFNVAMMDANADTLAPALLGRALPADEQLSIYFFDLVEEGKWTWSDLGKLCAAIWFDADGDHQDSVGDRLGIIADERGGINSGSFVYSCGERLTEAYFIEDETSEFNGKQWIRYAGDSTGLDRIFDDVKAVFAGPGSLSTYAPYEGSTPDNPGVAYHHAKFASGELLFAGVCLLGGLEDEVFQTMPLLYSVVPCPKTDVEKEYNSVIHNVADVGAINVNANPRKARVVSAYLQYCTEHSVEIREEFLEIVTKYKTTTYDQGTDRMLDLIYDGILWSRDKTVDDLVGGDRWHVIIKEDHFGVGADDINARYESLVADKQAQLDKYMEKWYTLPKSEN